MKKFQYFLLLVLFALPIKSFAQPYVQFIAQSANIDCETNTLSIDIDVKDFIDMNVFQFSINWDPTILTLNNLNNPQVLSGISSSNGTAPMGYVNFSWFSSAVTINDATILTFEFDITGTPGLSNITFEATQPVGVIDIVQYGQGLDNTQYTLTTGNINVTDSEDPTISCPSGLPSFDTGGATTTTITGAAPTVDDNCGVDFISYELTMNGNNVGNGNGDVSNNVNFEIGTTTVTYTVNDFGGNTETCSFDVIVTNNNAPTILTISMDDNLQVNCEDNTVSFNIYADNFTDIRGADFTITWPTASLQYVNISNYAITTGTTGFGISNVSNGELYYSWVDGNAISLPNGTILFTIEFTINSNAGTTLPIAILPNSEEFTSTTSFPFEMDPSEYQILNGSIYVFDDTDPTVTCPTDVMVNSTNGMNAIVNGIAPTTADNCGIMDTTYTLTDVATSNNIGNGTGDASGTTFPVGTTNVAYTVTDFDGNTATCNFDITVQVSGVITVAVDSIQVNCETGTVTIGMPVENFTDVIGVQFTLDWDETKLEFVSITEDNFTPNGVPGLTQVANGNLTFSWSDSNPATFQNGDNILVFEFNILDQTVGNDYDFNFINIPAGYAVTTLSSFPLNDPTAVSEPGNIEIIDNSDPIITCPIDMTVNSTNGTDVVVNGISPTTTDNCGIMNTTYILTDVATSNNIGNGTGDASGTTFPVGTTNVAYTVTDFGGNTATCNFDITVQVSGIITVSVDSIQVNCETGTVTIGMPVENFTDVIGVQFTLDWDETKLEFISITEDNFTPNGVPGLTQVANGNLTFSWSDSNPATFQNGDNILVFEFNILDQTVGNDYDFNFINIPAGYAVTTLSSFPLNDPTAVSEPGNIEIIDNSDPIITCPIDMTVNSTNGTDVVVNGISPTTTDNCGIMNTTYILTDVATSNNIGNGTGDASGTTFPVGTTNVAYTVTDFGGNTATCNFDITVQVSGIITVSVDSIQVNCETGTVSIGMPVENFTDVIGLQFTLDWDETKLEFVSITEDNFTPNGVPGLTQVANGNLTFSWSDSNPATFQDGDNILVFEFNILDQTVGNDYDFNFINIPAGYAVTTLSSFPLNDPTAVSEPGNIEIIDNTDPVITCPVDMTVNSNGGSSVVVNNIAATATDNCGNPTISYVILGSPPIVGTGDASGNTFFVGTTMVTYTATDEGGNSVNCSFNVTVIQDPLMIECPMSVNQGTDANVCSATLDLPVTILSDPNNINTIFWSISGASGPASGAGNISNFTFSLGTSNVIYSVSDNFGATQTCSFTVTITDQEGPIISGIPADVTVECDNIPSAASLTAMDQCDGVTNVNLINESVAAGPTPGSSIITRTWGTVDAAGNVSTANQTITVIDTTPPTITCPADISMNSAAAPLCGASVSWTIPTASDNCDPNVQVTSSFAPNDFFPLGTTIVTYYAEDNSGNIDSCKFNVTVNDVEIPVFTNCPMDLTIPSGVGCDTIVTWLEPTVTDNCDNNVSLFVFPFPGTSFMIGTTTVTYTAIDASGNVAICSFDVTVTDMEAPVITNCPMDMTISSGVACDTIVTWVEPTITDNCDNNVNVVVSPPSGTAFMAGTTTVTYTATDASGNISNCSFDITVEDMEAPVILDCPIDTIVSSGNSCSAQVNWIMPTATDNCDASPTITCNIPSGNTFSVGTTPIICTATDASGNTSTCTFNITVVDTLAPSVFCPIDVTISTNGDIIDGNSFEFIDEISTTPLGCDSVIVFFNDPAGNDNCGIPTITSSGIESGDTLEIGQHVIQFIATDGSGNVNTILCETTITITSFVGLNVTASPDTVCTAGSTQLLADLFTPVSGAIYSWTGPNPNRIISPVPNPLLDNMTLEDAGTYIVTVTNPNTNCTSIDSVAIVVSQGPELALIANTTNCVNTDGTTNIPLSVQVTNGVTVDSFIWTNPAGTVFSNDQNTFIFNATPDAAGQYCVEVFEADGCSNKVCETIQITFIPDPPVIASTCGDFVCAGESCTLTGFSNPVDSIIWTATGNTPGLPTDVNQSEITITPGQNGINIYTYTIIDNGCESSSSIAIIVSSPASVFEDIFPVELNTPLDFDVTNNDTIPGSLPGIFSINVTSDVSNGILVNNGDGTFSYTPDNGFIGDDQFIYEICLDCDGQEVCRWAIVTLSIETEGCIIPTVITPNGDGMNDTWQISCIKEFPDNEVIIFNRWGDEVYKAAPYNNDWEGTYNNEDLPDGTYFYIFKTTANDPDPFKGTVNVYR